MSRLVDNLDVRQAQLCAHSSQKAVLYRLHRSFDRKVPGGPGHVRVRFCNNWQPFRPPSAIWACVVVNCTDLAHFPKALADLWIETDLGGGSAAAKECRKNDRHS